jgi:3-dehydroquinate synthase
MAVARTLHGARILLASQPLEALGREITTRWPAHRGIVIADATVAALHGERLRAAIGAETVLTFPPGEGAKTREHWAALTDRLLALGCGRDTVLVALGGGVTGDLAGFVAATYLRGVPFVQCPTSLLAMIDAAIGGKCGVDTPAGKNLVGAIHHPGIVWIDPTFLDTLPLAARREGLAEAIKHAVIADATYLEWLLAQMPTLVAPAPIPRAIADMLVDRSVAIKCEVVAADEREANRRQVLNFGHTIGHAIEQVSAFAIAHGEAVAIGMVAEAQLAVRLGLAAADVPDRMVAVLGAAGLPVAIPPSMDRTALVAATRQDKKARAGAVRYALPMAIGAMAGAERGYGIPVEEAAVLQTLTEM